MILYLVIVYLISGVFSHIIVNGKQKCQQYSEDLFLCMEKVENAEDASKWERILCWTVGISNGMPREIQERLSSKLVNRGIHNFNRHSFTVDNMRSAVSTFDSDHKVETWVAFLWSSTIPPPSPVVDECILNIEMVMSVSTATVSHSNFLNPQHIYTWHMGITRNAVSRFLPGFVVHRSGPVKSSVLLHAFAAKVMRLEHPELLYVRSNMSYEMEDIIRDAVPDYLGTSVFFKHIPQIEQDSQGNCEVYDLQENLVWNGSYRDFDFPKYPGGILNSLFLADINFLAGIIP